MSQFLCRCFLFLTLLWSTHCGVAEDTFSKNIGSRHLLEPVTAAPSTNFVENSDVLSRKPRFADENGWAILYIIGVIYHWVALVIVCDKFYVPSIYLISKWFSIPKDAAGAIFMAGGIGFSEFLKYFAAIFIHSLHRLPITGDAFVWVFAFNAILVTSACAFASRAHLSRRSFLEGFIFSTVGVVTLVLASLDGKIYYYESFALLDIYFVYYAYLIISVRYCKREWTALQTSLPLETIGSPSTQVDNLEGNDGKENDCPYEPLSLKWPRTFKARLIYILTLPITLPMWLSLPDSSTPRGKKCFVWTFIGSMIFMLAIGNKIESLCYMVIYTYTYDIPHEIYSITYALSSPTLITSIIVARRGFGDMALAAANGRNVFSVCLTATLPLILCAAINEAGVPTGPLELNTGKMGCSILLFLACCIVQIVALACFKWKLGIGLGVVILVVYILIFTLMTLFEREVIWCFI